MPAGGRSKSAKKLSPLDIAKEEAAKKQTQIEELTEQLKVLREELDVRSAEVERLRKKLHTILPEILSHRDREKFPLEPVDDPIDVDAEYVREMIYMLVDDLYIRRDKRSMVEQRIEDLETRVTEQSLNYQHIVRKNLSSMASIEEALEAKTPADMQRILRNLKKELLLEKPVPQTKLKGTPPSDSYTRPSKSSHTMDIIHEMENTPFPLTKPLRKQSGDTHIRYLLPEIKQAVCNELSLEKKTGGDWRAFAQRIGVSTETILFWRRLNLKNTMEQVLTFWKDSKGATVRMLHRHLKSPEIYALIPAKLISDFYKVD
ncbi:uncharacterized protein [Watersipora subatra]|uniref:uncharacterized protein n=1 Tax=Watersipora subatra TaxID=2589382 RepID=UPI00355B1935